MSNGISSSELLKLKVDKHNKENYSREFVRSYLGLDWHGWKSIETSNLNKTITSTIGASNITLPSNDTGSLISWDTERKSMVITPGDKLEYEKVLTYDANNMLTWVDLGSMVARNSNIVPLNTVDNTPGSLISWDINQKINSVTLPNTNNDYEWVLSFKKNKQLEWISTNALLSANPTHPATHISNSLTGLDTYLSIDATHIPSNSSKTRGLLEITLSNNTEKELDFIRLFNNSDNTTNNFLECYNKTNLVCSLNNTGDLLLLGDTQSTDISSGVLQIEGGIGIKKNTNIGGDLVVNTSTFVVNSNLNKVGIGTNTPGELLDVVGNAWISGNIKIGRGYDGTSWEPGLGVTINANGNILTNGNLTVDGITTFGGGYGSTGITIKDNGNIETNGKLIIDEELSIGGGYNNTGLTVDNLGNLNMNGNLKIDSSLTVGDDKLVISNNGNIDIKGNLNINTDVFNINSTTGSINFNGDLNGITPTKLSYLDATSSIQTQFNTIKNKIDYGSINGNITNKLLIGKSDGTLDLQSYTGDTTITTVGNINNTEAVWNGSKIDDNYIVNSNKWTLNANEITNIKTKYNYSGTISNGKLLIGSGDNYVIGSLTSNDNSITITENNGSIDLKGTTSTIEDNLKLVNSSSTEFNQINRKLSWLTKDTGSNTLISREGASIGYALSNSEEFRISSMGNNSFISFYTGSANSSPNSLTEKLRILKNGNIGIGTQTPENTLDINGTISIGGNNGIKVTNSGISHPNKIIINSNLEIDSNGTISQGVWNGSPISNTKLESGVGIANNNLIKIDSSSVSIANNEIAQFTGFGLKGISYSNLKTHLLLNNVENTKISTWSGSTNINTLGTITTGVWDGSPITKLGNITTDVSINSGKNLNVGGATTLSDNVTIASGKTLSVGTTSFSPGVLTLSNPEPIKNRLYYTNSSNNQLMTIGMDSSIDSTVWNMQNGYLRFGTNDTERMRIKNNGNLGVGISSNIYGCQSGGSIHIKGNIAEQVGNFEYGTLTIGENVNTNAFMTMGTSSDISWIQSQNLKPLCINPTGNNVGIGTSVPTDKLHIVGGGIYINSATNTDTPIKIERVDSVMGGYMNTGMSYGGTGNTGRGATGYLQVINNGTNTFAPNFSLHLGIAGTGSEKITALHNGNIGISSPLPQATLHIGNSTWTGAGASGQTNPIIKLHSGGSDTNISANKRGANHQLCGWTNRLDITSNNYIQFIVGDNVTNHLTTDEIYDGGASGNEIAMTISNDNSISMSNTLSVTNSIRSKYIDTVLPETEYDVSNDYYDNNYPNGYIWYVDRGGNYTGNVRMEMVSYGGWGSDAVRFYWKNNNGSNGPGVSATLMEINNNKTVTINGSLTVSGTNVPSDKRIKTHISTITSNDYMSIIRQLELKKYKYNIFYSNDKSIIPDNEYVFGWIAQEINEIYPQAVTIQTIPTKLTMDGEVLVINDLHTLKKDKLYDLAVAGVKYLDSIVSNYQNHIQLNNDNISFLIPNNPSSNNTLLEIHKNGNIGIGTQPQTILHVSLNNTNTNEILRLENTNRKINNVNKKLKISFYQSSKIENVVKEIGNISTELSTSKGTDISFSTENKSGVINEKMRLTGSGYIGIGTTTPKSPLDIQVYDKNKFSIISRKSILINNGGVFHSNDNRCFKDNTIITPNKCLNLINLITLNEFKYIDDRNNSTNLEIGIVSSDIYAPAENSISDYIPNIYQYTNNVITNNNEITITFTMEHNCLIGDKLLVYYNQTDDHLELSIIGVHNNKKIVVLHTQTDIILTNIFVYGKLVRDYKTISYEKLIPISIGAIQDLTNKTNAQQDKITSLENENNLLKYRLTEIETLLKKHNIK